MDKKKELCKIAAEILNVANECGKEQGEWINQVGGFADCSLCGFRNVMSNYCPNCGTRMLKGEEA